MLRTAVHIKKQLTFDYIKTIRENLDSKPLEKGLIHVGMSPHAMVSKEHRMSKIYLIPRIQSHSEFYDYFSDLVYNVNAINFRYKLDSLSLIQYSLYDANDSSHINWHVDNAKLTFVIQLSTPDEYDGGELQFNNGNIMLASKEIGSIIVFPSYLLHRVTPITRGIRRSLVIWADGPPLC